ncbi:hypothetical protein MRX96_031239 [Rhipicephalus microplus]
MTPASLPVSSLWWRHRLAKRPAKGSRGAVDDQEVVCSSSSEHKAVSEQAGYAGLQKRGLARLQERAFYRAAARQGRAFVHFENADRRSEQYVRRKWRMSPPEVSLQNNVSETGPRGMVRAAGAVGVPLFAGPGRVDRERSGVETYGLDPGQVPRGNGSTPVAAAVRCSGLCVRRY